MENCTSYHFSDVTKFKDFDFGNMLLDAKIIRKYFDL